LGSHEVVKSHPEIESVLTRWRASLDQDYPALRGHIYRMYNYCRALAGGGDETDAKIAIAGAFHDTGIWSHDTFDYLGPSRALAADYLSETGRSAWEDEVSRMIVFHHKITAYREPDGSLVEAFRRADLVDISLGMIRFGLPREFIRETRRVFPIAGFHRRVIQFSLKWGVRHPLNPLPMFKW
jgi:hypothetical protein